MESSSGGGRLDRDHAAATFCYCPVGRNSAMRRRRLCGVAKRLTRMTPVSRSTYNFSVSTRSVNGFTFLAFPSAAGDRGGCRPVGVIGVMGCVGSVQRCISSGRVERRCQGDAPSSGIEREDPVSMGGGGWSENFAGGEGAKWSGSP